MSDYPPVVSIVGVSNSGKTTLIENCVELLTARGYHVATIKHKRCSDVAMHERDSSRHAVAGARDVVLRGADRLVLYRAIDSPPSADAILDLVRNADIVFSEGLGRESQAVVEISRAARSREPLRPPSRLFALVTDNCLDGVRLGIPVFGLDEYARLVDCIESSFLRAPVADVCS